MSKSRHVYDLVAANGEYQDKSGNTKKKWVTVGRAFENDKGMFLVIDAHINFAAFPRDSAGSGVMISCFQPKDLTAAPMPGRRTPNPHMPADDLESDVPF